MKILGLYVEKIKRIKVIDISPSGNMVVITGKNRQGKSSTLDSIAMVLGGKKLIPEKPVREGETEAKIVVKLDDYTVTRWWTNPETSYLKLETNEGAQIKNAQTVLDNIIGSLTFDPLEFTTVDPKKRVSLVQEITGLDFSEKDKEHKELYEKRRDLHRDGSQTAVLLKSYDDLNDPGETVRDISDIKKDLETGEKHNAETNDANGKLSLLKQEIENHTKWIKSVDEEKLKLERELKTKLDKMWEEKGKRFKDIESLDQRVIATGEIAKRGLVPTDSFNSEIELYHKSQANKKRQLDKKNLEEKLKKERQEWEETDKKMKAITIAKDNQMSEAKMPVDGMSIGEKEILFNKIPFSQLSSSEQIRISFAMAMSINPKLKIAMIKNGSLLDEDAMKEIEKIVKENDYQCWIERVSNSPESGSIYIEDGEVKK